VDLQQILEKRCELLKNYSSLKAIELLEALSSLHGFVSIHDLCEITQLSASTVHRILQDLFQTGYVKKNEDHLYKIGLNAMALGLRINKSEYIIEAASEEMDRLNELSKETVHLIVLDENEGRYIAKREAKNQIGLKSKVGWTLPLYCTSGGKVLMAFQSQSWIDAYLSRYPLEQLTENTIHEPDKLLEELEAIRKQGFALDKREHHPNVVCVAAPIFDAEEKVICSIGLSAPDYRFSVEKALSYVQEISTSAHRISELLKTNN
jgi:DNA-binding IclR family transcriptional regulator